MKKLGYGAFDGCTNLRKIAIPEGVTSVAQYAFRGCTNMECVYIPRSLKKIESDTFTGCKYLEVCYGGSEEQWNQILIDGYAYNGSNKVLYDAPKHFNCQPSDINKYAKF